MELVGMERGLCFFLCIVACSYAHAHSTEVHPFERRLAMGDVGVDADTYCPDSNLCNYRKGGCVKNQSSLENVNIMGRCICNPDSFHMGDNCEIPYAISYPLLWNLWQAQQMVCYLFFWYLYASVYKQVVEKDARAANATRGQGPKKKTRKSTQRILSESALFNSSAEVLYIVTLYAAYPYGLLHGIPFDLFLAIVDTSRLSMTFIFLYSFALSTSDGFEDAAAKRKRFSKLRYFLFVVSAVFFLTDLLQNQPFFREKLLFPLMLLIVLAIIMCLICVYVTRGVKVLSEFRKKSHNTSFSLDVEHLIKRCTRASVLYVINTFIGIYVGGNVVYYANAEDHRNLLIWNGFGRKIAQLVFYFLIYIVLQDRKLGSAAAPKAGDNGATVMSVEAELNDESNSSSGVTQNSNSSKTSSQ